MILFCSELLNYFSKIMRNGHHLKKLSSIKKKMPLSVQFGCNVIEYYYILFKRGYLYALFVGATSNIHLKQFNSFNTWSFWKNNLLCKFQQSHFTLINRKIEKRKKKSRKALNFCSVFFQFFSCFYFFLIHLN